ncbi:protein NO VEIN domain-containing protein [Rhodococcus sp. NPDC057135]|uniref:protein NO VEIN domain-containing protein n=1 Tax=Rhodococcus sp. NPDC057135 TaxID=3346028 RepID=UPI00363CBA38
MEEILYGWWETFEHYCVPGSSPVATSSDLMRIEEHARAESKYPRKQKVIGRRTGNDWRIAYVIRSSGLHEQNAQQAALYDKARQGGSRGNLAEIPPQSETVINTLNLDQPSMEVFDSRGALIVTWNPDQWDWGADYYDAIERTAMGESVPDSWSTGGRKSGVDPEDRVFLLRQGAHGRGIVACGSVTSEVYEDDHWDGSSRSANYVRIEWSTVLAVEDMLPTADLEAAMPKQHWSPRGGGIILTATAALELEELWSQHCDSLDVECEGRPGRGAIQGRELDPVLRKKIEDAAQDRLMEHYRSRGWKITDTRIGNPFDATAEKDGKILFLEAKGTQTLGAAVLVTQREVEHARVHADSTIMGIWSGIEFNDDGDVDQTSGKFRIIPFNPESGELTPVTLKWCPSN